MAVACTVVVVINPVPEEVAYGIEATSLLIAKNTKAQARITRYIRFEVYCLNDLLVSSIGRVSQTLGAYTPSSMSFEA
ncbi:hypothetical protein M7I_2114 [Glarea lozoyensis 74030]|uniref:Uncharacterized protein n=1 Tax=Glarea lozoyensis (strain ATCC 74030 / MF5533) TaxID=1104152 RepID=H0EHX1_GLAL7|nr:hypothetical protein M7I_2114 [Glarea lozoyensis 74030]